MRFLVLLMALFAFSGTYAQYQISGKVFTAQNEALPGASVVVQGSTTGTVTNLNGEFFLAGIEKGKHNIKVSFVGYQDFFQELEMNQNHQLIVHLKEKAVLTDEVFVYATRAGKTTPVTSTTLSKTALEKQNLGQDIPYLLSTTPSFVTSSDAGTGIGYTNFRIRGTDANRINITVNGIPVNDAESHGVYWVNMPDFTSSVENIQVQRGVGTSTQGAAAFGASINMQTNQLREEAYAEYSGATGSFNTWKNTVRLGSGLLNEHFSLDARLSKISSDGFIDRASSNLKSYFVSGAYYADNTIVKVNIFSGVEKTYQAWNGVPSVRLNDDLAGMQEYEDNWLYSAKQTQEMIASDSRTYNLYTYENETDNYQQDHYQALFSHQFSPYINFNAAMHYTYGRGYYEQYREDDDLNDYGLDNVLIGNDTISSSNLIRQKWLDNDFYGGNFSVNYQKDKSNLTIGSGWNKYDGRHFGKIIWAQYASNGEKDYEWYRGTGIKTDFNAFVKYNYSLLENLNLYADLQYRDIIYSIAGKDDDMRDLTQEHTFGFFNPKLGVFYQPTSASKAYFSWAVGHREPSRSNFVDADPNGKQPTFETLNDFEAGYSFHTSTLNVGANVYYMLYKNQLILTGEINDVGSAIMTNVDDSYRAGIEVIAAFQLHKTLNWEMNATFSQNQIINFTEYVDNWDTWGQDAFELGNTTIAFSPTLIANSMLTYEPVKHLSIGLISQYISKQYVDNGASDERSLDAYFVNNLRTSYTVYPGFAKEIEFTLLVNNLFNEVYETNAWVYSYILGGERYQMDGYFPQAGTNFLFGVNVKF
ncbi:MAG: TonB-dependent receptor [Prolixibacteraceae bacterium]